jgi:hypothetical protein
MDCFNNFYNQKPAGFKINQMKYAKICSFAVYKF